MSNAVYAEIHAAHRDTCGDDAQWMVEMLAAQEATYGVEQIAALLRHDAHAVSADLRRPRTLSPSQRLRRFGGAA